MPGAPPTTNSVVTQRCRAQHLSSCPFAHPSKTTLLDLVAVRKTSGRLAPGSHILYNGRPPTAALLRRQGALRRCPLGPTYC